MLESFKITHVAIPLWDPMVEQMVHFGLGKSVQPEEQPHVFMLSLRDWDLPPYLRALNYPGPSDKSFQGLALTSFALQAEQAPELALSRLADLFVERGQLREAKMIREVLQSYPRNLYALAAIANIDHALRDSGKVKESLETMIPYLSRRAARRMPIDRRASLAILLFKSKRNDLAKEQLALALQDLDSEALRDLTPNATAGLLAMSRFLAVPFSSEALRTEALEFVPLRVRERLVGE